MPLLISDRPPTNQAAIVSLLEKESTNIELRSTVNPSRYAIRRNTRQHRTNAPRQRLSLEHARGASLRAAAWDELERYTTFARGWDGYDGDPISPVALKFARLLIGALPRCDAAKLTDIIPGPAPDGSLDLEFRTASRRLMLTMYGGKAPDVLEVRTLRCQGDLREEKSDIDGDTLVADLRWLLA